MTEHRFLRALKREPVDTTPVWIMRQAGRYLPEYRATRERAGSFLALAKTPELDCESLAAAGPFDLDAAILFSDILTIPDAMGLGLHFIEGEGPKFERPLRSRESIMKLGVPDPESELRYVTDAVRLIRRELAGRVPLIGFSGSPWTLACYMIEGGGSSNFSSAKALMWNDPDTLHHLLDINAQAVIRYLSAQVAAGAQALMVFDTWGGMLSPQAFVEFSQRYLTRIVQAIKSDPATRDIPVILFSKGANGHLETLADSGCDALGLDWTIRLSEARERVGARVALQGNLDPATLAANPQAIRNEVKATLADFGPGPGHVFNLGHGITPDIDPDHLGVLVDAVHEFGRR